MKNWNKIGFLSILLSAFFVTACDDLPGEDEYVSEQLASITNYDTKANFSLYKTYSIADSITLIKTDAQGNVSSRKVLISSDERYRNVYEQVKKDMTGVGYEFITYSKKNHPDLGVSLVAAETTSVVVSNPWWWWGGDCWWDWWDCYYPPYPYYPYPYVVGSYTVGTLGINIADLTVADGKTPVPIVWVGTIRSLLYGNNSAQDVRNAIDDCFHQTKPFYNR